jgi:hypothetical protein
MLVWKPQTAIAPPRPVFERWLLLYLPSNLRFLWLHLLFHFGLIAVVLAPIAFAVLPEMLSSLPLFDPFSDQLRKWAVIPPLHFAVALGQWVVLLVLAQRLAAVLDERGARPVFIRRGQWAKWTLFFKPTTGFHWLFVIAYYGLILIGCLIGIAMFVVPPVIRLPMLSVWLPFILLALVVRSLALRLGAQVPDRAIAAKQKVDSVAV